MARVIVVYKFKHSVTINETQVSISHFFPIYMYEISQNEVDNWVLGRDMNSFTSFRINTERNGNWMNRSRFKKAEKSVNMTIKWNRLVKMEHFIVIRPIASGEDMQTKFDDKMKNKPTWVHERHLPDSDLPVNGWEIWHHLKCTIRMPSKCSAVCYNFYQFTRGKIDIFGTQCWVKTADWDGEKRKRAVKVAIDRKSHRNWWLTVR